MPADHATLSALKARVEAATGPDRNLDVLIATNLGGAWFEEEMVPFLTGSVDDVVATAERVLPGWRWVAHSPRSGLAYGASLSDPKRGGWIVPAEHPASAPLAILLALIKAVEHLAENPASATQPETSHAR